MEKFFEFECRVIDWANDKIRVNFLSGVGNIKTIGKKIDTREYDYVKPKIAEIDKYTETETLKFSLESNFKNELIVDYSPTLDGLSTLIVVMTTDERDQNAYNSFNFDTAALWDEFWFAEKSRMLLTTSTYILGEQ